ncbi:MAG: diguanylate cyclase [Solirubrobacterales bacterium]
MPAPGFTGLVPRQAYDRLDQYARHYKGVLEQINSAQSAGSISASKASQLRATVNANTAQLNSNYFAWRDAYNASQNGTSSGGGSDNGSGSTGSTGGTGSGSGEGTGGGSGGDPGSQPAASSPPAGGGAGSAIVTAPGKPTGKTPGRELASLKGSPRGGSGKRGSGGSGSAGDGGSGVPGSGAKLSAAAAATDRDAAADKDGDRSGSGAGSDGSSSADGEGSERAAISRAVEGIPFAFRALLLILLFAVALLSVVSVRERRRAQQVERISQLDYLTGLSNREGFDRALALEWRRALRYGRPLGLVFVDLDHFKAYNDTHGHLAGDRLLREVAAAIDSTARGSDFTARLGGDEFVILCPETSEEGLKALTQRLAREAKPLPVKLSVGRALQRPDDSGPEDLVARADSSMYRDKGGRRRNTQLGNPMLGSIRRSG